MAINATDPIPVRLAVCPAGIIRSVPIQHHTTVHFLTRDRKGRVLIDPDAREEGWAFVDELYEEELADEPGAKLGDAPSLRRRELERGREDLNKYCVKHEAGRAVAFQLNPGTGESAAGVSTFPNWALPTGIVKRRERAATKSADFVEPVRPVDDPAGEPGDVHKTQAG